MAVQTGRTVGKHIRVIIDDSGGVVRDIPVSNIGDVGLTAATMNLTALQDAVQGFLTDQESFEITMTGPFDTAAAQSTAASGAAAALSGSHTILSPIANLSTPLTWGIYVGMRHNWESGEPTFGLTSSATSGFLVRDYIVKSDGTYSIVVYLYPGSSKPAWGTAVFT